MKYADVKTVAFSGLDVERLEIEVHKKDYVEIRDCGLSVSQDGTTLRFTQQGGCYSEAATLPGFDQSGQRVGSQTNVVGPVSGPIISGVVIGELNIKGDTLNINSRAVSGSVVVKAPSRTRIIIDGRVGRGRIGDTEADVTLKTNKFMTFQCGKVAGVAIEVGSDGDALFDIMEINGPLAVKVGGDAPCRVTVHGGKITSLARDAGKGTVINTSAVDAK